MAISDAFTQFKNQVFNRVLPPSVLDPVGILSRAMGYPKPDPTFTPAGPRGKDILAAMRGRGDPLANFNWYCELPILTDNTQLPWEYIEEATMPFIEFEQQSNYRAGKMCHYPGHYSLGTVSVKLFENSRGLATKYVTTWQNMVLVPLIGAYNHPSEFKKPVKFTIFDVAKMTAMFITYEKCWPMRMDPFNLQSSASDRINPSLELSTDDIVVQFAQYDPNDIPSIVDNVTGADSLSKQSEILRQAARVIFDRVPLSF